MSRFEAEISGQNYAAPFSLPGFGTIPPPPQPPMLVPHQVNKHAKMYGSAVISQPAVVSAKPTLYAAPKPAMVTQASVVSAPQPSVDFMALQSEVEKKLKKLKNEKVSAELAISQG